MGMFEKVEVLRQALVKINGNKPLEISRDGLSDTQFSQKQFVNPALLPKGTDTSTEEIATHRELELYSDMVMQAVWNIAAVTTGYLAAYNNKDTIKEAFRFLDQETWVPKIVDERTYQIGKALSEFLTAVIDEDLASLPESVPIVGKIREPAQNNLIPLRDDLAIRLKNYELHSPKHAAEVGACMKIVVQRKKELDDKCKEFFDGLKQVENFVGEAEWLLKDNLMDRKKLREIIRMAEEQPDKRRQAQKAYVDILDNWKLENQQEFEINGKKRKLPDTIESSLVLANLYGHPMPSEIVLPEWMKIFNSSRSIDSFKEDIQVSLDERYKRFFRVANQENLLEKMAKIKGKAEEQLIKAEEVFKEIQPYVDQLDQALVQVLSSTREVPEFYSAKEEPKDSATCEKMIEGLKEYLKVFQAEIDDAHEHFEENNPPQERMVGELYDKAYKLAMRDAKGHLLEKKEQKVAEIRNSIQKLQVKQNELAQAELLASNEQRASRLQQLGQVISERFAASTEARTNATRKRFALVRFTEDFYRPEVKKIDGRYEPRMQKLEEQLGIKREEVCEQTYDSMKDQARERRAFLEDAKKALIAYHQALANNPSAIYFPTKEIPQNLFKKYLEIGEDEAINNWIDGMYKRVADATGIWGSWNAAKNNLGHYTTLMGPSSYQLDLQHIEEVVAVKLAQIDEELKIDITEKYSPQPQIEYLGEDNLYALQRKHRLKELTEEKAGKIAELNEKLRAHELRHAQADVRQVLVRMQHEQALIENNAFVLDCKLSDVEKAAHATLRELNAELEALDSDEKALEYWAKVEKKVKELDIEMMLDTAKSYRESSANAIQREVKDGLSAKLDEWSEHATKGIVRKAEARVTQFTEELPKDLQELKEKTHLHFNKLLAQKEGFEKNRAELKVQINNKIINLELSKVKYDISQLLKRADAVAGFETQEKLLADIIVFEDRVEARLQELDNNKDKSVQDSLLATRNELTLLTEAKNKLQLNLLKDISNEAANLSKTSEELSSANCETRTQWAQAITNFEEKIKTAMESLQKSALPELQTVEDNLQELQRIKIVIPELNNLEDILTGFKELAEKENELTWKKVAPVLELSKKLQALTEDSVTTLAKATVATGDHPAVSAKGEQIEQARKGFEQFQKRCAEISSETLYKEVLAEANALKARISVLESLPYHQRDRKQLQKDLIAFLKSALIDSWNEIEKSSLDSNLVGSLGNILDYFKTITQMPSENTAVAEVKFEDARDYLEEKYFGKKTTDNKFTGHFGDYLNAREKEFWFRDMASSFVALFFGCVGYKTEAQLRTDYLSELKVAFQNYKEDPDNYEALCTKIKDGEKFKPRTKEDGAEYDKTLQSHLATFKTEVETIHKQNIYTEEERIQMSM
ncbi:hypothetical protein [Legionella cardiaca]|uniref:Uncharacterized protein n=1 Tax=Legionella cardiaca TaxID=1071983 RepID=A0ABY8ATW1_9GAMM|nr:hypothetical protein [Legionella cardiaca]WED43631.1 hypothetical protein PXX05_02320 [Legionella cardiaca]